VADYVCQEAEKRGNLDASSTLRIFGIFEKYIAEGGKRLRAAPRAPPRRALRAQCAKTARLAASKMLGFLTVRKTQAPLGA